MPTCLPLSGYSVEPIPLPNRAPSKTVTLCQLEGRRERRKEGRKEGKKEEGKVFNHQVGHRRYLSRRCNCKDIRRGQERSTDMIPACLSACLPAFHLKPTWNGKAAQRRPSEERATVGVRRRAALLESREGKIRGDQVVQNYPDYQMLTRFDWVASASTFMKH